MKKQLLFSIGLFLACSVNAQSYSICPGAVVSLTATNPSALSNPSYSLDPGGLISSSPVFTVNPAVTTSYTLYTTGTNTNMAVVTTSNQAIVNVAGQVMVNLSSTPGNFTLGCGTKSTITASVALTVNQPNSTFTFTFIPPGTSSVLPTGFLNTNVTQTINTPGTWTLVVRNHFGDCEIRLSLTVLSNTYAPAIDSVTKDIPILTCDNDTMRLRGYSNTPNVSYNWSSPLGISSGALLRVYPNAAPNQTMNGTYTLSVMDNNNLCSTNTLITVIQNIFPPIAKIGGNGSLTCLTNTLEITNQSYSGIPSNSFPNNQPVIGYLWKGPLPQMPLSNSTSYTATTIGTYTLVAKDLNNGCTTATTAIVGENKVFPVVNNPVPPSPAFLCEGSVAVVPVISSQTTNLTFTWTAPPGATITGSQNNQVLIANSAGIYTLIVRDAISGCISEAQMPVLTCVGIAEYTHGNIFVYPNPSNGYLTFSPGLLTQNCIAGIYDVHGKLLLEKTISENHLDIRELPEGVYLLRLHIDGFNSGYVRVVKE